MAVSFQDGEPVDAAKLNELAAQVSRTEAIANRLQIQINSGDGTQTSRIPIITGDTFKVTVTNGVLYTQDINFGTVYYSNEVPDVVASVRSGISATVKINVSVVNVGKSPQIQIFAEGFKGTRDVYVSWIAHYARIVPAI